MVVALERSKFNTLYKYDQIPIAVSSIIDTHFEELQSRMSNQNRFESLVRDLDRILPIFELDHEVLLLEINKSKISIGSEITISFDSVVGIYPLTRHGANLLFGKLNDNIIVGSPVLEQAIQRVKSERSIRLRVTCAKKLLDIFSPKVQINQKFRDTLQATVRAIVHESGHNDGNFLYSLLTYDKTPSYLPAGNVEFILKVGVITLVALNKDEGLIKNGSLYKRCLENRDLINHGSIFDGLTNFETLLDDRDLKNSYEKVIDSINLSFDNLPIFKISYHFLALKAYLNKNEKNLLGIAQQLLNEAQKDPTTFVHVLLLIGYTFSYEELYESIHSLEQSSILKKTIKLNEYKRESNTIEHLEQKRKTVEESLKHASTFASHETTLLTASDNSTLEEIKDIPPDTTKIIEAVPESKTDSNINLKLDITNRTVRDFEEWIASNGPEKKRKKWAEFISQHFPIKDNFITLEDLATALNKKTISESDLFIKTGKNKFDGTTIDRGFFKK